MNRIFTLQYRLNARGHDPGPLDGVWGPRTRAAVEAYRRDPHEPWATTLTRLGIRRPRELHPLHLVDAPVWMRHAADMWDVHEDTHREELEDWAGALGMDPAATASQPWCGLFVAHLLEPHLRELPPSPLAARSWLRLSRRLGRPVAGAVVVLWRGDPDGWQGHVGLVWCVDGATVWVLGGNQGDAVDLSPYPLRRVLGYRWPDLATTDPRPLDLPVPTRAWRDPDGD